MLLAARLIRLAAPRLNGAGGEYGSGNRPSELKRTRTAAWPAIRSFSAIRKLRNLHADPGEEGALRSFIGRELDQVILW